MGVHADLSNLSGWRRRLHGGEAAQSIAWGGRCAAAVAPAAPTHAKFGWFCRNVPAEPTEPSAFLAAGVGTLAVVRLVAAAPELALLRLLAHAGRHVTVTR